MDSTLCESRAQTWRFTEKTKKKNNTKWTFTFKSFTIVRPIAIESCQCKFLNTGDLRARDFVVESIYQISVEKHLLTIHTLLCAGVSDVPPVPNEGVPVEIIILPHIVLIQYKVELITLPA